MKVRVRLHGTLRGEAGGVRSEATNLEVAEGTTAGELLGLLGLREARGVVMVMGGRVMGPDDPLAAEAVVEVFQAIAGG